MLSVITILLGEWLSTCLPIDHEESASIPSRSIDGMALSFFQNDLAVSMTDLCSDTQKKIEPLASLPLSLSQASSIRAIAPLRLRGIILLLADFLDHPMATQAVAPPTPMDGPLEDSFPEKDGNRQQFID